ncbi:STAS domain-containing protein [Streptomyces boninensis]|uniref:STAS domain-containing protein n=1 Tax=Streptomyces boninensis TaxID=2039455 RepID=UPI003B217AAF
MTMSIRFELDCLVIELPDVIDIGNEAAVRTELLHRIRTRPHSTTRIILDLTAPLATATAISVVLDAQQAAAERGLLLSVAATRRLAREPFRVTSADRRCPVYASLDEALFEGGNTA